MLSLIRISVEEPQWELLSAIVRDWTEAIRRTLGILHRTEASKGIHIRTICQKNEGAVKIKQKPAAMDGRTMYRTLSPKRTSCQIGYSLTHGAEPFLRSRQLCSY
jgi:hypothetical protein